MKKEMKKLEETLIQIGLKIARRGEGAIFVVGETEYKPLVSQKVPPFNVLENPKLLESLALMDGAVIIDHRGVLRAYGVMIKTKKAFKNFGTRHSAALTASQNRDNTVFIVSEEDKKIKILKEGKMIMQIDALEKNVAHSISPAANILESIGVGTIGAIGTSILAPTLGIALLPGVVLFGSAYYLARFLGKKSGN